GRARERLVATPVAQPPRVARGVPRVRVRDRGGAEVAERVEAVLLAALEQERGSQLLVGLAELIGRPARAGPAARFFVCAHGLGAQLQRRPRPPARGDLDGQQQAGAQQRERREARPSRAAPLPAQRPPFFARVAACTSATILSSVCRAASALTFASL